MANFVATAIAGLVIAYWTSKLFSWRKAYSVAKSSGFPVFLSPIYLNDLWWVLSYHLLLPWLKKLPDKWTTPWLQMAQRWHIWRAAHKPFGEVGSDTFILSTPRGNMLWTCDRSVINQLETHHTKSQLALKLLKFFKIFGPSVGTVEAEEWARHRKVIMTGFEPSTNALVWKETIRQTRGLLGRWSEDGNIVPVMKHWTSRLALHVISDVFFDKHLTWGDNPEGDEAMPAGHCMTFDTAIFKVIENLQTIFMTPKALRNILPLQKVREANLAFKEWTTYLQELLGDTVARVDEIATKKNKTIVESIVLAAKTGDNPLSEESIMGNIFFMLLAGHETSGNTLSFALSILALYPEYQSKIQEDLDRALAERPMEEWTVEREFQTLQKGWIGAVLKEVLRVYCVVQLIPRQVVVPLNVVDSDGTSHTIPEDTLCLMNLSAAFKNPSIWSQRDISAARREELHHSPAAVDFEPAQWLADGETTSIGAGPAAEIKGHHPFGQGPHLCPGRLFAQVEIVAALATILAKYSLELVVSEQTLASCAGNEVAARAQTRDNAFRMLVDDIISNINIMLLKEMPVRLVERT